MYINYMLHIYIGHKDQNIEILLPISDEQQQINHEFNRYISKAIENNEDITFQHIKIFVSGSSAAGKTNLRYSLLGQKFVEEHESTDIQETKHAYIANNAGVLETNKGKKIWREFNLQEQLNQFKSLWEHRFNQKPKSNLEHTTGDISNENIPNEDIPSKDVPSEVIPSEDIPSEDIPSDDAQIED